jgi:hypothetical protein
MFQPTDEHPFIDMGFNSGWLLGIYFAKNYPEFCVRIAKDVFEKEELFGANVAVDSLAEALRMTHYPSKAMTDTEIIDKWVALGERMKAEQVVTEQPEGMWPLPLEWPEEYQGA